MFLQSYSELGKHYLFFKQLVLNAFLSISETTQLISYFDSCNVIACVQKIKRVPADFLYCKYQYICTKEFTSGVIF